MSQTAHFIDKDHEKFSVIAEGELISIVQEVDDVTNGVTFYAVDAAKIIDGLKAAMLEAALGGTYSAGEPLTDSGDDA